MDIDSQKKTEFDFYKNTICYLKMSSYMSISVAIHLKVNDILCPKDFFVYIFYLNMRLYTSKHFVLFFPTKHIKYFGIYY